MPNRLRRLARVPPFLAVALLSGAFATGCGQSSKSKNADTPISQIVKKSDHLQMATDILRHSPDIGQCKEAVQIINAYMRLPETRLDLSLPEATTKMLTNDLQLSPAELEDLRAPGMTQADAYHIEARMLLREAKSFLEEDRLEFAQQADHAFRWACRTIALHEQGSDDVPVVFSLRRGAGSDWDRACAFLALAEQFGWHGALVVKPGPNPTLLLTAIATEAGKDFALFDARHAKMLAQDASAKPITWSDALKNEKLLAKHGISAKDLEKAECWLAIPRPALAARMRETEKWLGISERVKLFTDPAQTAEMIRPHLPIPIKFWPKDATPKPLLDRWTQFLPPEEGGEDKTGRMNRYKSQLAPWSQTLLAFRQINLWQGIQEPSRNVLLLWSADLFSKYDRYPQEMLLRCKIERLRNRLVRLRPFIDDSDLFIGLADNQEFLKDVLDFRETLNDLHLKQIRAKAPSAQDAGQAIMTQLWNKDPFFSTLMRPESEDIAEVGRDAESKKNMTLSRIMAHGCRDYLYRRNAWYQASAWQELAEESLAKSLAAGKGRLPNGRPTNAKPWISARGFWNLYLDRHPFSEYKTKLGLVRKLLRSEDQVVSLHMLETVYLELHENLEARMRLARAVEMVDGAAQARRIYDGIITDLQSLVKDGSLADELKTWENTPAPDPLFAGQRSALLRRDWGQTGYIAALQKQAEMERDSLPTK